MTDTTPCPVCTDGHANAQHTYHGQCILTDPKARARHHVRSFLSNDRVASICFFIGSPGDSLTIIRRHEFGGPSGLFDILFRGKDYATSVDDTLVIELTNTLILNHA